MKKIVLTIVSFGYLCAQAGVTPLMDAAFNLGVGSYKDNVQAMVSLISRSKPAYIMQTDNNGNDAYKHYLYGGTVHGNQYDQLVGSVLTTPKLGITPLMSAAYLNFPVSTLESLIKGGASVNEIDSNGHNALYWYLQGWYLQGGWATGLKYQPDIVALLTPKASSH